MNLNQFSLITEEQACEQVDFDKYINGSYGEEGLCLLFEGDLKIVDHLDLDQLFSKIKDKGPLNSLIVKGDLLVEGLILQNEGDYGVGLLVFGNLKTQGIFKGGSEVYIDGNVDAADLIYGFSNHGKLTICGDTYSNLILCDDHLFEFEGKIEASVYDCGEIEGKVENVLVGELDELFHEEIIPEGDFIDSDKVLEFLLARKKILK